MKRFFLFFTLVLLYNVLAIAQSTTGVAINNTGTDPDNSAMLDVSATNKGILVPRLTQALRTAIALPAKGLLVYQNNGTEGFYYFDGSAWTRLANGTYIETDPVFGLSPAHGITSTNITNWNTAYSWGNHALAGYAVLPVQTGNSGKFLTTDGTSTQWGMPSLSNVIASGNSANGQVKNVTDPTDGQDAATKAYVDALLVQIEALKAQIEPSLIANGFTDFRDGNHYQVVKIGNQVWMAENLKYLPSVVGPPTGSYTLPYYYVYDYYGTDVNAAKATANYTTYGVLYNWNAAIISCPAGWHLPGTDEWTQLTDYLGGTSIAGSKLKETGITHWASPNSGSTNESGFTALPGSDYSSGSSNFGNIGYVGSWWSATEHGTNYAWARAIFSNEDQVSSGYDTKGSSCSVRCIRD